MGLRTALVLDCPSLDAENGKPLSAWEWTTTAELMKIAGFKPEKIFLASTKHFTKWPAVFTAKPGGPLKTEYEQDRQQLIKDLAGFDIALTMGVHAMFCLTGETKIDTFRGTHIDSPFVAGLQVVPTYAPFIYARLNWSERPVVISAMRKALKRFTSIDRRIFLPENTVDLYDFSTKYIKDEIVFDVETNVKCRITEFSIATSSTECLYVQLEDRNFNSIWSAEDELQIWLWLSFLASRRDVAWGFHNATYDLTYLDKYGIRPAGHIFDTMLRHHAYQPEMEKSLGFLSSLYIPTTAWKHLRTKAKKDFNKAGAI